MQEKVFVGKKVGRVAGALCLALVFGSVNLAPLAWAAPTVEKNVPAATAAMSNEEVNAWVALLDPASRKALFESEEAFAKYLQQETTRKAAVQAVKAAGFGEEPKAKAILARKNEELLLNLYLGQQLESRLDKNYPPVEEVKSYYQNNKEKLQIEERVSLSQIFLAVPEKASAEEEKAVAKKAKDLAASLQKGSVTFAAAAEKNSDHQPSRLTGGFMGVVKASEMIPEVKKDIMALAPGAVSAPVRSKSGWHIFKMGEKLAVHPISLEEAEPGIRQLLIKAEQEKLGQKVVDGLLGGKTVTVDPATSKKLYSELKEKQK